MNKLRYNKNMRNSILFENFGNPIDQLDIVQRATPQLAPDEVLVKMHAAPINPSDLIPITGAYAHRISLPAIAGYEGVGTIYNIGAGLSQHLLGQRVLPLQGEGTWQTLVKCPAAYAFPVPDLIDDFGAAQLYINPLTAWILCTQIFQLKPQQTLAINAAGSAIGKIFAQLSQILGFRLIALTRSDCHTSELLALGAEQVINSHNQDFSQLNVDAAVDSIGGKEGTQLARIVRAGGKFQALGLLSGQQIDWQIVSELPIEVGIFHLRYWNTKFSAPEWQSQMTQITQLVTSQKLLLNQKIQTFPFTQIHEALEFNQHFSGKVILTF